MTRKSRRLALIASAVAVIGIAVGLVLFALRGNVSFFYSPTEYAEKAPTAGTRLSVGGLVKDGTVVKGADKTVTFTVTDTNKDVRVSFTGLLPDLFREGQGVVAAGVVGADGWFRADSVLAKHDEKYMPRDVADALKKQGVWNEGQKK